MQNYCEEHYNHCSSEFSTATCPASAFSPLSIVLLATFTIRRISWKLMENCAANRKTFRVISSPRRTFCFVFRMDFPWFRSISNCWVHFNVFSFNQFLADKVSSTLICDCKNKHFPPPTMSLRCKTKAFKLYISHFIFNKSISYYTGATCISFTVTFIFCFRFVVNYYTGKEYDWAPAANNDVESRKIFSSELQTLKALIAELKRSSLISPATPTQSRRHPLKNNLR